MKLKEVNKKIDTLFKEWQGLCPLKEEYKQSFDQKLRLELNYNSNHMEGNTLTYGETELLLVFGRCDGGHLEKDYMEMKAHDIALEKIKEFANDKNRPLTEGDIRNLNKIILKEPFLTKAQTPDGKETSKEIVPGQYKTQPNHVRTSTGEIFKFSEPEEVPMKMQELMKWFKKEFNDKKLSISLFLAELHHRFILIHPFDDGNGRIIRLWINYVLIRLGYPPLVIKSKDKDNYLLALNKADTKDMDSLAVYLGRVLIKWLEIGIKAAKGKSIEEISDVDKEVDLFIKEQKGKGLSDSIVLSHKIALKLCDDFLQPFWDSFDKKLACFSELFESKKMELIFPKTWNSPLGPRISQEKFFYQNVQTTTQFFEFLKEELFSVNEIWETIPESIIFNFCIFHNDYKGKGKELKLNPFNMKMEISLKLLRYEYEFNVEIARSYKSKSFPENISIKEEYNTHWTGEKVRDFIAKIKKEFLSLLKKGDSS